LSHERMQRDTVRVAAFVAAIGHAVKGKVVLDIGAPRPPPPHTPRWRARPLL